MGRCRWVEEASAKLRSNGKILRESRGVVLYQLLLCIFPTGDACQKALLLHKRLTFVSAFKVSGNSRHDQLCLFLVRICNIFEKFLCRRTFQNLDLLPIPIEKDFAIFCCPIGKHFLIKSVSLVYVLFDKPSSPSFVGIVPWSISVELVYHLEARRRDIRTPFKLFSSYPVAYGSATDDQPGVGISTRPEEDRG